jgi:formylglycine-generating enzyme required for sulfatase activity
MLQAARRYHLRRGLIVAACLLLAALASVELAGRWRASQHSDHLTHARWAELPAVNADILRDRRWTETRVRSLNEQARKANDAPRILRTSLALLPMDSTQLDYVFERTLNAEPDEIAVLTEALAPFHADWVERAWAIFSQPDTNAKSQRLRAAALLAALDPEDDRWNSAGDDVALLLASETFVRDWMNALRPVRDALKPKLIQLFDSRDGTMIPERTRAGEMLIDYYADDAKTLAQLLPNAHQSHFRTVVTTLVRNLDNAIPLVVEQWNDHSGRVNGDDDRNAHRKANCGIALVLLGEGHHVWPTLAEIDRPDVRSVLIDRMAPLGVDPMILLRKCQNEADVSIRRALMLALGEYGRHQLPPDLFDPFIGELRTVHHEDTDPGAHSAAEWLLRQWGEPIGESVPSANNSPAGDRRWYDDPDGHTMVVVNGPVEFLMGSPETELHRSDNETQHRMLIERTFAIASKEVTVAQFRRFLDDSSIEGFTFTPKYAPADDCPQVSVSWYLAADYCNWLSRQQGIPPDQWCFVPNESGDFDRGMRLAEGYLHKTGYRLPSEAEWEYSCRAYSLAARSFGEAATLAPKYDWHLRNAKRRTWPVDSLKPNELGLFNMLGNAFEWTMDPKSDYIVSPSNQTTADVETATLEIIRDRVIRGGSWATVIEAHRSAHRAGAQPGRRSPTVGFRVARTLNAD